MFLNTHDKSRIETIHIMTESVIFKIKAAYFKLQYNNISQAFVNHRVNFQVLLHPHSI